MRGSLLRSTRNKMEGWRNLLTDLNVVCKSTANVKATLQFLKQELMRNNTAGGSLYEYAQVGLSNSPAEMLAKLAYLSVSPSISDLIWGNKFAYFSSLVPSIKCKSSVPVFDN